MPSKLSRTEKGLTVAAIPILTALIGLVPWAQSQIHPLSGLSYTYHLAADGVVIELRNDGHRTLHGVEVILDRRAYYVAGDAHKGMELQKIVKCSSNGLQQQLLADPAMELNQFCARITDILPGGIVEFHLKTSATGNLLSDNDLFIHHNNRVKHAMVGSFKNAPYRTFLRIRWELLHTALTILTTVTVTLLIVRLTRKNVL